MTDINLAASPTATPLASLLASENPQPEVSVYRGIVTPIQFDAQERETAALVSGAAAHDAGWLRRVQVRGEDRFRWLSGMVTNMVNDLGANAGAWNLVLNAQGRIQGDVTVWREDDGLELEIDADQYDRLMAHLDRFIIMDDVELTAVTGESAIGLAGPQAVEALARLGLPALPPLTQARAEWDGERVLVRRGYGVVVDHYAIWTPDAKLGALWKALKEAGAKPVGTAVLDAFRIAEGIPAYGVDIVERDLAQETSQMRALNFSKGCYLGQEIVERIRSRGSVHRHLLSLELDGPLSPSGLPPSGTKLMLNGAEAGHVTSSAVLPLASGARAFAMGMIRGEAELRKLPLSYTAGEATGTARILATPPAF